MLLAVSKRAAKGFSLRAAAIQGVGLNNLDISSFYDFEEQRLAVLTW